jgi:hypothetical protein
MRRAMALLGSVPIWVAVAAALVGFLAGRMAPSGTVDAAPPLASPAAGTPAPECILPSPTPEPSPTPSPTPVPPAAMNQPLPYAGGWTIAVKDATNAPRIEEETATGVFVRITLAITNTSGARQAFPYSDFVLRDGQGRVYELALAATGWANPGQRFSRPPGGPTDLVLVYDVPAAVPTGELVLESTVDPTFRVRLAAAQRG